ncbi:MAG: 4Fe-4S binding protein [Chloroflexi bacterium]|nr:4Fe-4S binding protein [Chloroflexota bacterium]
MACPQKILEQEAAYEAPMTVQSICKGCAKCVLACPLRAIDLN